MPYLKHPANARARHPLKLLAAGRSTGRCRSPGIAWRSVNRSNKDVLSPASHVAVVALPLLLLGACGDPVPPIEPGPPPTPQFLSVSPDTVELTYFGERARVRATARPQPPAGTVVKWTSTDTLVVTVSAAGEVVAVGNGVAAVVAELGALRDTAEVSMRQGIGVLEAVGNGQRTGAGQRLPERVGVRILDPGGSLFVRSSPRVRFDASADGGRVHPAEVRALGAEARTEWTLGPEAGPQSLVAELARWRAEIGAVALPRDDDVAVVEAHAGDEQWAWPGDALPEPVVVRLVDAAGERVAGVTVQFEPDAGHGSADPVEARSGIDGLAATRWRLGDVAGAQRMVASVGEGGLSAEFGATGLSDEGVCARNPVVADGIVRAVGAASCAEVTDEDLAGIETLNLSDRNIRRLRSGDLDGLFNLRSLLLNRTRLAVVAPDVFADLRGLEQLWLGANEFEELPPSIFSGLRKLKHLIMGYGQLPELTPGLFAGLPALESLSLDRSGLAQLPPDLFANLRNLRDLRLQDNELSGLPPGIFADLKSLEWLFLHGNRLGALPEGVFAGLLRLEWLRLDKNWLTDLPPGVFAGLSGLEELRIGQNVLTALRTGVFADLASLRILNLPNNELEVLPPGVFVGLHNLEEVHVVHNPGSPFPLGVEFERIDADDLAPDPARVVMRIPAGAPFAFRMPLSVQRGTASAAGFEVAAGDTVSGAVTVSRPSGGGREVHMSFGQPPGLPRTHSGLAVVPGEQIVLFAEADNRTPVFEEPLPDYWTQAGGAAVALELGPYFEDPDGDSLVYAVEVGDGRVAAGRIEGTVLWMEPRTEGETVLEVTAADPDGLIASQRMALQVSPAPNPDRFDIEVIFQPGFPEPHKELVWQAVERWEEVLVGDLPDVPVDGYVGPCGDGRLRLAGTVDDLVIEMHSNTRGLPETAYAFICGEREQSALPFHGGARYSERILRRPPGVLFYRTVLHEIGHVVGIGIGRAWDQYARESGDDKSDPHYAGPLAIAAFDAAGGREYLDSKVPLHVGETYHWRNPAMVGEIMVGAWGGEVLSAITVQALADQGYVVDVSKADAFKVNVAGQAVVGVAADLGGEGAIEFTDAILELPVMVVDSTGKVVRVIRN